MLLKELHIHDINLDKFEADCIRFLEAIRGTNELPWHGSYNNPRDWEKRPMNWVRSPRDTPHELNDDVNDFFEEKFGWRARQQGIFVTGNRTQAMSYGHLNVIFPVGEFQSLWSPYIVDLLHTVDAADYDLRKSVPDRDERRRKSLAQASREIREATWYYNSKLAEGLEKRVEVILGCKEFYIFNVHETFNDMVRPFLVKKGYIK